MWQICDLELGSRAPTIGRIGVSRVKLDDRKREIDAVDFDMDVDYSGGIGIAIDLALAYNKSAFLSAKGFPLFLNDSIKWIEFEIEIETDRYFLY